LSYGYQSLENIVSSLANSNNVAVGIRSQNLMVNGGFNTTVGNGTMEFISSGNSNQAYGYRALRGSAPGTTGIQDCTAIGITALSAVTGNTSGVVAIGNFSFNSLLSGSDMVAVGTQAMSNATSGVNTVSIGSNSLGSLITGNGEVAIGTRAMPSYNGGSQNVGVGNIVAPNFTSGNNNTFIGSSAAQQYVTGNNSTIIGANTIARADRVVLAGANAQTRSQASVVIGTDSNIQTTLPFAIAIGDSINFSPTANGVAIGDNISIDLGTNVGIFGGGSTSTGFSNSLLFGPNSVVEANNEIKYADVYTSLKLSPAFQSNPGIGFSNLIMDINGRVYRQSSLREQKSEIVDLGTHPDFINHDISKLTPRAFKVKATGDQAFGLVAEEVQEAGMTGLLTYEWDPENPGQKKIGGVAYHMIPVFMVEKYKQLEAKLASLEALLQQQ
jgi:hypothetical protein